MHKEVRPYTASIVSSSADEHLRMHLRLSALAQIYFHKFIIAFEGLITPDHLKNSARSTYAPGSKKEKKSNKSERNLINEYPLAVHYLNCRFKLMSKKDNFAENHIVSAKEIRSLLFSYWKADTGFDLVSDQVLELTLDSIEHPESASDQAVWIDCRSFANEFFTLQFSYDDIARCLRQYPLAEKPNIDSFRTTFSEVYGTGEKSDFGHKAEMGKMFSNAIKESIKVNSSPKLLILYFAQSIKKTSELICDPNKFIDYVKGVNEETDNVASGRSPVMIEFIKNNRDHDQWIGKNGPLSDEEALKKKKELLKKVDDKILADLARHEEMSKSANPIWLWLRKNLLDFVGISYDAEFISDAADNVLAAMRSKTSIFYNTIDTKYANQVICIEKMGKPLNYPWIKEITDSYKRDKSQVYMNGEQLRGFDDVISYMLKGDSLVDSVKKAQTNASAKFGDINLFLYIANYIQKMGDFVKNKASFKKVHDDLRTLIDIDELQESIYSQKWPYMPFFSVTNYSFPYFGTSKPKLEFYPLDINRSKDFLNKKYRPNNYDPHFNIKLACQNKNGKQDISFGVHSKRFVVENLLQLEDPVISVRNDSLSRLKNNGNPVQSVLSKSTSKGKLKKVEGVSVRLLEKNDQLSLIISVNYAPYVPDWKSLQTEIGKRFISVDLGHRNAGAYVICERVDKGQFRINEGDYPCDFKIVKYGYLDQKIKASDTNEEFCVLSGESSMKLPAEYIEIWKSVQTNDSRELPDHPSKVLKDIAYGLCRYVKSLHDHENFTLDYAKFELLYAKALGRNDDGTVLRGIGGCSFDRLEKYEILKRSVKSLIRLAENNGYKFPEQFKIFEKYDELHRKHLNIRNERIKRVSNSVLKLAINHNCDMIICEDLLFNNKSKSTRRSNRSNTEWCAKQIVEKISQGAALHGIHMKRINPAWTSQRDYFSNSIKTRYRKVNALTFMNVKACKDYENLCVKDFEDLGLVQKDRLNAWEMLMVRHGFVSEEPNDFQQKLDFLSNLKLESEEYIPSHGDAYFCAPVLASYLGIEGDYIDADLNAAFNIFIDGYRLFTGANKKSK